MKIRKKIAALLCGILSVLGITLVTATPAQAAGPYWLTNDTGGTCQVYLGGSWQKVSNGSTKKGLYSNTVMKCSRDWKAVTILGGKLTGKLDANKNYSWSDSALAKLNSGDKWAVAQKY